MNLKPIPRPPRRCAEDQTTDNPLERRTEGIHREIGHFGDHLRRKPKKTIRLLLQNVGGIGFCSQLRHIETLKMEKLRDLCINQEVDLLCLTEVNKRWSQVNDENLIWNVMPQWVEHSSIKAAWNQRDPGHSSHQTGGTVTAAFNDTVHRIKGTGHDPTKLGRFSYIKLQGRNNCSTVVISAYCPCFSSGPYSVYAQHLNYMNIHKPTDDLDVRAFFWNDLETFVRQSIDDGDQIILTGDFNSEFIEVREWMLELGLVEGICEKHGYEEAPNTYQRSKNSPIDGIFVSPHLRASAAGYLSFGKLMGDHRGLWMDLPVELLFGYNPPSSNFAGARRLKLSDPRVVERYTTRLHEACEEHNIYQRMHNLHTHSNYPHTPQDAREYEIIDTLLRRLMQLAEDKCRSFKAGEVPWSPTYQKAHTRIKYWSLRLLYIKKVFHNSKYLQRLQRRLCIEYTRMSVEEVTEEVQKAHDERRRIKNIAESLSIEYRTRLAQAKEAENDIPAATHLRNMNKAEAQRRLFRTIKVVEQKLSSGSTSRVIVMTANGDQKELTTKAEIETAIIEENEKKYHQTEGTSQITSPILLPLLGKHGEGPAIDQILNGTFNPPPGISQSTIDFLQECKLPDNAPPIPTPDIGRRYVSHVKSWRVRKEKTASANEHIGHYKACAGHPQLSWLMFQRMEIPDKTGYSPTRHRSCIDLMILKKSRNFLLSKQRTLGLLDSEFNHSNGRMGKNLMDRALCQGCIAPEQYSRPNRSAIEHALNRRLTFDHQFYTRCPFCLGCCDLTGCYDRILHTIAALVLRKVGVSKAKIHSMFSTIQRMVHCIRTAFGDSKDTYGGDDIGNWELEPQGILQGNASGPHIWTVVSSTVFNILRSKGHGSQFCTALSREIFVLVGFSYVDDCDLIQTGKDVVEVMTSMQQVVDSWTDQVEVTGGALEPSKSWYYLVDYKMKRGKWTAYNPPCPLTLSTRDKNKATIDLQRLPCDKASEMLGIYMAPSGNRTKMVEELRKKAVDWASRIRLGRASPQVAWTALHTTISAKLKYALPACTFNEAECNKIMAPAIMAGLPRAGISRMFPRALRHAPTSHFGLDIIHLYTQMGTARVAMLVDHCWRNTPTGQFLRLNIEDIVLESGLYGPLWDQNYNMYASWCQTDTWIFQVCKFNADHHITIDVAHSCLSPRKVGDKSIMAAIYPFLRNSKKDMRAFNRVRMLHGIIHLSDLTQANGRDLDHIFLVAEGLAETRNPYLWPLKHHVTNADFAVWRKGLEQLFPDRLRLRTPLTRWTLQVEPQDDIHWYWFQSEDREFVYERVEDRIFRHLAKPHSHTRFNVASLEVDTFPLDPITRISVTFHGDVIRVVSAEQDPQAMPPEEPLPLPNSITHIKQIIRKCCLPWTYQILRTSPSSNLLLHSLRQGTALLVSDGSYYPATRKAGAAWIISTPCGSEYIEGAGRVPGDPFDSDSYRSEMGGIIGSSSAFCALEMADTEAYPNSTVVCDNKGALQRCPADREWMKTTAKHFDLVSILSATWETSLCKVKTKHVYGHQDNKYCGPLPLLESLNVRMDILAKEATTSLPVPPPVPFSHQASQYHPQKGYGRVTVQGDMVTSKLQKGLYNKILAKKALTYLADKCEVDDHIFSTHVYWDAIQPARREATVPIQIFMSKWVCGQTATGVVMVKRKQRISSECPRCGEDGEHLLHILTCKEQSASDLFDSLLDTLEGWLTDVHTNPLLTTFLIDGLRSWQNDPRGMELVLTNLEPSVQYALQSQLQIGWYALLCGYITKHFESIQTVYYQQLGKRNSGRRWAIRLIGKLWQITHSMWCHRNEALHESPIINARHGLEQLHTAVRAELQQGLDQLAPVFQGYFRDNAETLLAKPAYFIKRWFLVIRIAREANNTDQQDAFTHNPTLRSWIFLP